MSLVGSLRGVQASPEPCNSNSNSILNVSYSHSQQQCNGIAEKRSYTEQQRNLLLSWGDSERASIGIFFVPKCTLPAPSPFCVIFIRPLVVWLLV
jgi:hypothetical protein